MLRVTGEGAAGKGYCRLGLVWGGRWEEVLGRARREGAGECRRAVEQEKGHSRHGVHAWFREGLVLGEVSLCGGCRGSRGRRGSRAHLQMLEAGMLGGRTRGVVGADDSLHMVPGQQQAQQACGWAVRDGAGHGGRATGRAGHGGGGPRGGRATGGRATGVGVAW